MFLLRSLIRGLTSSILRLALALAVLFACYQLAVKPLIGSAGDAIDSTKETPRKLLDCTKRSGGDVKRLRRCARSL
jgi:hypothetical protein